MLAPHLKYRADILFNSRDAAPSLATAHGEDHCAWRRPRVSCGIASAAGRAGDAARPAVYDGRPSKQPRLDRDGGV